jgi:hypothetical protein
MDEMLVIILKPINLSLALLLIASWQACHMTAFISKLAALSTA